MKGNKRIMMVESQNLHLLHLIRTPLLQKHTNQTMCSTSIVVYTCIPHAKEAVASSKGDRYLPTYHKRRRVDLCSYSSASTHHDPNKRSLPLVLQDVSLFARRVHFLQDVPARKDPNKPKPTPPPPPSTTLSHIKLTHHHHHINHLCIASVF